MTGPGEDRREESAVERGEAAPAEPVIPEPAADPAVDVTDMPEDAPTDATGRSPTSSGHSGRRPSTSTISGGCRRSSTTSASAR